MEIKDDNKSVRICPFCKEPYKIKVGIHNWKKLFRKPTLDDWITLFILIMLSLASFAYIQETKQSKMFIENIDEICLNYNKNILNLSHTETSINIVPAFLNITINETNIETTEINNFSVQIIGGEKISYA